MNRAAINQVLNNSNMKAAIIIIEVVIIEEIILEIFHHLVVGDIIKQEVTAEVLVEEVCVVLNVFNWIIHFFLI